MSWPHLQIFKIKDWNLPTVYWFKITNVDWVVTYINQKFTPEIRNRWQLLVSVGLTLQGIFFNFQEHFLCIYSRLVFKKLFFTVLWQQSASSLLKVFATTVCYLHMNIHLMSIINQSAFLIWNKATIVTLQYSIWKWNFDSNNAIHSRLMKVIPK